MEKYKVIIKESLLREILIEADDINDAIDIVRDKYRNSEVVLDADDFSEVEFTV